METFIPREIARRKQDRTLSLERKLGGILLTLVSFVALYFWNESRQALKDIEHGKMDIIEVRGQIRSLSEKVESSTELGKEDRQEIKESVRRLEEKVNNIHADLAKWFLKAGKS